MVAHDIDKQNITSLLLLYMHSLVKNMGSGVPCDRILLVRCGTVRNGKSDKGVAIPCCVSLCCTRNVLQSDSE